jgi:hypothetical protein
MTVTRWKFDYGGTREYYFPRNPDRYGGDSYWQKEPRMSELDIVGASQSNIQIDGFRSGKRTLRFTSISGQMMRKLQDFYSAKLAISNCYDHLSNKFNCMIIEFVSVLHPSLSTEDLWDLEMILIRTD